jgi:lysozyme family protein
MSDPFDTALRHTLGIEGGYSDDATDPGGETKFGITEAVAREFGYAGEMRDLSLGFARGVYRAKYWDLIRLGDVADLSEPIAVELFDTAVNCGVAFAAKSFQQVLNAFNREQSDYSDIAVDGLLGPATLHALRKYLLLRAEPGVQVLVTALNVMQGAHYIQIVEHRTASEKFIYGWFSQRVRIT